MTDAVTPSTTASADALPARGLVRTAYTRSVADPLTVRAGEPLMVEARVFLWEDNPAWLWVWCVDANGRGGWVVPSILGYGDGETPPPGRATARRDYTARELTVAPGDLLALVRAEAGWYWATRADGEAGWVPQSCVLPLAAGAYVYPRGFFAPQLAWARTVANVRALPFADAVLRYTALYRILGLPWSLDPAEPTWQAYVAALASATGDNADEPVGTGATYRYYLDRYPKIPQRGEHPHFGCFGYEYDADGNYIHMHFGNYDPDAAPGVGPLSSQRREARLAELRALFSEVARLYPQADRVQGHSWLYNRQQYTRLYPPAYAASARPVAGGYVGRGLWGQFLRHDTSVNEEAVRAFGERLAALTPERASDADLAACFPCPMLAVEAPIAEFYHFYGLERGT